MKSLKYSQIVLFYIIYLFISRLFLNILFGPWLSEHISKDLIGTLTWCFIKFIQWVLPIAIYLKFSEEDIVKWLKQHYNLKFNIIPTVLTLFLWSILILAQKGFSFTIDLDIYTLLYISVFTGIVEEFIFRGFILEKLNHITTFHKANITQAILFSLIHIPYYYALGFFNKPGVGISALISVFILAIVAGYLTKYSKSLIPATLLHILNNVLV